MALNPRPDARDDLELQPSPAKPELNDQTATEPLSIQEPQLEDENLDLAANLPAGATLPADGPPPSDKVDFENLPEFVWQRKMLRNVRIVAVLVSLIVAIALALFFFGTGKAAHDSLKPIIEGTSE